MRYEVRYTTDFGATFITKVVEADNKVMAYVNVLCADEVKKTQDPIVTSIEEVPDLSPEA